MTQEIADKVQVLEGRSTAMEIKIAGVDTQYQGMKESLVRIETTLTKVDADLTSKYVTKESFQIVQGIVFGLVGLIVIAVVGAWIASVVISRSPVMTTTTTTTNGTN